MPVIPSVPEILTHCLVSFSSHNGKPIESVSHQSVPDPLVQAKETVLLTLFLHIFFDSETASPQNNFFRYPKDTTVLSIPLSYGISEAKAL